MIRSIAILGAGTMGQGLARLFVKAGLRTMLYDPVQDALVRAESNMQAIRTETPHASNWQLTSELKTAVVDADLVLESAPENLDIKRQLYQAISPLLKADAIVASNTSTFSLSTLSHHLDFANRFIIAHFFNPPDIIPLVEIVRTDSTPSHIAEAVAGFLAQCGKVPVILKKDIPGFVANRLQAAVLREACFLVESGVVDPAQVDTVMRESIGLRWAFTGPFQVADYGGLDIWEKVLNNLLPQLNSDSEVPLLIREKVEQKNLGLKSGNGFYSYDSADTAAQLDWRGKLEDLLNIKSD